jgi:hypothetical protein
MIQKIKVVAFMLGGLVLTYFFVIDTSYLEKIDTTHKDPAVLASQSNAHTAKPIPIEKTPIQEETIKLFAKANATFIKLDKNKDQYISKEEWDKSQPFDAIDVSRDRQISFEEYAQYIAGVPVAQRTTHTTMN